MGSVDDTILARLRTQGVSQFISQVGAASKSVLGFGAANEEAAAATKLTWIETQALNNALYTARRYAFYAVTALATTAAAAVKMGITFDDARSQATNAFEATLGSAAAARREVQLLTADTHATGMQLSDLAREAETMQSFGFTLKDVNTDVLALANYAERAHKGVSGFQSLVEVFDRIHQKGELTSLDLRALTSEGIPALQILAKQLNLTPDQLALLQKNKLIIPAQYALPALAQGIGGRAGALGTNLSQQLGITHSWLAQIFGTGESGLFGFITKGLQSLNKRLGAGAKGLESGGVTGLLTGLDPSGKLLRGWQLLVGVFGAVAGAFHLAWTAAYPLRILVGALADGSAFLATRTGLLSVALKALALWYVLSRTRMLLFVSAEKIAAATTWALGAAEDAAIVALYAWQALVALATGDTIAFATAMDALNLALLANPITWIVIGVAALGIGLYLLVTRVKAVRDAFVDAFDAVRNAVYSAFDWLVKLWNKLSFHVGGFSVLGHHFGGFTIGVTPIALASIPGLAEGGNVLAGGTILVGEDGPELLNVPAGAQVAPLTGTTDPINGLLQRAQIILEGVLNMDGVKVGEVVARATQLREQTA